MLSPPVRGNKQWWGYCSKGQNCYTTCDAPKSQAPFNSEFSEKKYVKRGDQLPVEWLRQNHPGGFVRLAFAKFDNSDDAGAFDSNPIKYVCYETNCREDYHDPMLGELNGPGYQKCSTSVTIPDNLPDGPITLQWTWYGGGVYYADQKASFANYVSCSDMIIKGGNPYQDKKIQSEFKGGDVATSDPKQCRYWATNSVFGCPRGAEDYDKNGCGYSDPRFGPPLEWSNSAHTSVPDNNRTPNSTPNPSDSNPNPSESIPNPSESIPNPSESSSNGVNNPDSPASPDTQTPPEVSNPNTPAVPETPPVDSPAGVEPNPNPGSPDNLPPVEAPAPPSSEPSVDASTPPVDTPAPPSPAPPVDSPAPPSPAPPVDTPPAPPSPQSPPKCHRRKPTTPLATPY